MGMNLHCFSLSECKSWRMETPSSDIPAQNPQKSSLASNAGHVGTRNAQHLPSEQPRADSASPWWLRLIGALPQSGKWLLRNAIKLILPVQDPFCMKARFKKAFDELKKSPSDYVCIQKFFKFYELVNCLSGRVKLESLLTQLGNEGAFKLMKAAKANPAWEFLVKAAESHFEETSEKKLFLLFTDPFKSKKWKTSFKDVRDKVDPSGMRTIFKGVWERMGNEEKSILFSALYKIDCDLIKYAAELDKVAIKNAQNDLVQIFQQDVPDQDLAKKAIHVLKAVGANHKVRPGDCALMPILTRMNGGSLRRLEKFARDNDPESKVMYEKISKEIHSRENFFKFYLKDKFGESLQLLRTAPLQAQLPLWSHMDESSRSERFEGSNISEAAKYILSRSDIFSLVCLATEFSSVIQSSVLRKFSLVAQEMLKDKKNFSSGSWHLLLDKEMDEVGKFLEEKVARGDKSFENMSTSWELERNKRARLKACKEFEDALKNFLVRADPDLDIKLKLPDMVVMQAVSEEDMQRILQRSVANTPRERLLQISSMAFTNDCEAQLIVEVKEQLQRLRTKLMDDACLLFQLNSSNLSIEITDLLLAESRKRSKLAHEAAESALIKSLAAKSAKDWLHGLIVFLDRKQCAHVFDAANGDSYDDGGWINIKLNKLKQDKKLFAEQALNLLLGVMDELQREFGEINDSQKMEFNRLHEGVRAIYSSTGIERSSAESDDFIKDYGDEIKSALLDYLEMPQPGIVMRCLTQHGKELFLIESGQQVFDNALRRPSFDSEGDLLLVCDQFRKDVVRSDIVIGGQLMDKISVKSPAELSKAFVQKMRLMDATDAQIKVISMLATQSTSQSYDELGKAAKLHLLNEKEADYIEGHKGEDIYVKPFGTPKMHHSISKAGVGAIKLRTVLSDHKIKHLNASDVFLVTNPEKSSFRAEMEFIVDEFGRISPDPSLSDYSCREVIDVVRSPDQNPM